MDESMTFSDVEVGWDHDSPTPAAWRLLQGPGRNEDTQCSPKLPRTKRIVAAHPRLSADNHVDFEASRKEANQIINALRRASREGETSKSSLERRLIIPELPEEEESEDEKNFEPVPFRKLSSDHPPSNTSIDLLFDMSGRGEDLAATAKSTNPGGKQAPKPLRSPVSDAWTDDDLFDDDALMLEVDNVAASIPTKSMKLTTNVNETAQKTSTPFNSSKRINSTRLQNDKVEDLNSTSSAKGFLDFFMDEGRPVKPSPKKEKSNILPQRNNYKFMPKNKPSSSEPRKTVLPEVCQKPTVSKVPNKTFANNAIKQKTVLKKESKLNLIVPISKSSVVKANSFKTNFKNQFCINKSKPMDTSIPLDILEELITEDSWTENEDEIPPKKTSTTMKQTSSSTTLKQTLAHKPPTPHKFTSNCKNSYKFIKTDALKINCNGNFRDALKASSSSLMSKKLENIKSKEKQNVSSDCFSDDDDDLLLEAVALSESQKCSAKGNSSSAPNPVKKVATSTVRSNPPSQGKCTASEIERKKRLAMERKMQRMKHQRFLR